MEPGILRITSPDGYVGNAVLMLPEGKGPFPGVLAIHGGMGNQSVEWLLEQATCETKAVPIHLWRQGYAVLVSDYRHPSLVNLEIDDTIAAYEYLCAHPRVIRERVALCGTSHGAVCATYAGMRLRPAGIVAEEAATDLAYRHKTLYASIEAQRGDLDAYTKLDKELWDELVARLGGTPAEVPDAYERASAHSQAHKIEAPILILTGDGDYQPHCLLMAAALLKAGKRCTLAAYEKAWHCFWWNRLDVPARAQADARVFAFLAEHLRR